jgi:hypothetical protein
MSPRSFMLPRSIFGSLTLVAALIAAAVGLAFYSHVADSHNRAKHSPTAEIADWTPPAGLIDVGTVNGCTKGTLSRCLTSTATSRTTATSVAHALGVQPIAVSCHALRGALGSCNFEASIGSTDVQVVVTDQAYFVPAAKAPAKPSAGSAAVGSVVQIAVPGSV